MLTLHHEDDLLDRLVTSARDRYRPVVFLVGSPLTAPAAPGEPAVSGPGVSWPGVPGVAGMFERVRRVLGEPDVGLPGDADGYQQAFGTLYGRRGPDSAARVVREAVLEAAPGSPAELRARGIGSERDISSTRTRPSATHAWISQTWCRIKHQQIVSLGDPGAEIVNSTTRTWEKRSSDSCSSRHTRLI